MIPVVGEIADGISAVISLARGDIAGALLDASSMIPFLGNITGAAKIGAKVAAVVGVMKAADKIADVIAPVTKVLNKAGDFLSPLAKVVDNVTGPLKKFGNDALAAVGSLFAKEGAQKLGKEVAEEIAEEVTEDVVKGAGKVVDDAIEELTPVSSGISRPSKTSTSNSIYEQLNPDGTVKSRAFYDENSQLFSRRILIINTMTS